MKILLVEDEQNVVSMIQRGLSEEGYEVSVAMDGSTALDMAKRYRFDLFILDIMLPGINGLEVCRAIRQRQIQTPVLMLTALGTTENVVSGLDSGADDYLVKPFKFAELQARIRALLRRPQWKEHSTILRISNLELDQESKSVSRAGNPIRLTSTEFKLLEYFMQNQRKVLSRVDLLDQVWGINFNMGTNVVDVYVNYLRKKIDRDYTPRLIHTVIGMGYVMKESEEA